MSRGFLILCAQARFLDHLNPGTPDNELQKAGHDGIPLAFAELIVKRDLNIK